MEDQVIQKQKSELDIRKIRSMFPILNQEVNGYPLAYFDNAATTQKPQSVINALGEYYKKYNSNVHRGAHTLAESATSAFEETREAVQEFINAPEKEEIIFTKGTTESINLVAASYGQHFLKENDEIIISGMEHHSNIVPWQLLRDKTGVNLKIIPVTENGELDLETFDKLLTDKTRIVSVVYASNSLGPYILWPENAKKSQFRSRTSTSICAIAWAASRTVIAP